MGIVDWLIETKRRNDAGGGDQEGLGVKWVGGLAACVEAMIGVGYDL